MEKQFKIRCSQISKIMGPMGLTEVQKARIIELDARRNGVGKPLTDNMNNELDSLLAKQKSPELPQTCKSYLHEWYANDNEQIYSKYMDKGNFVEDDLIELATEKLNLGFALKNIQSCSDEYFSGTCDIQTSDTIVDVKACWNNKTLQENAFNGINSDYEWQLQGYCHLYNKPNAVLFFGLLNTPEDVNYNIEVSYEHIPINERWIAFKVTPDVNRINQVIERVKLCREYLESYDKLIKSKLGQIL